MTDLVEPRTRPTLSRELITETALRLSLEQPTEPLTLTRLGAALGADPTAIYRHFRNRAELIAHLCEQLFGQANEGLSAPDDWRDALAAAAGRLRSTLLSRPALAVEAAVRFTGGSNERAGAEILIAIFRRAGFDDAAARLHARTFGALLMATVTSSAAVLVGDDLDHADDMETATRLFGEEFPYSAAEYEEHTFAHILRTYVAGLESLLHRGAADKEPTST